MDILQMDFEVKCIFTKGGAFKVYPISDKGALEEFCSKHAGLVGTVSFCIGEYIKEEEEDEKVYNVAQITLGEDESTSQSSDARKDGEGEGQWLELSPGEIE